MTWPTTPPPMPAPGWYPDPEYASTWRWWDGVQWVEVRQPMHRQPPRDPYSLSSWFEQSTEAVKAVVKRVGAVVLIAFVVCFGAGWVLLQAAMSSDAGREIRDLLDFDDRFGSDSTIELTSAERDRLGDLAGDLARTWLPWLVVLGLVTCVVMFWGAAIAARAAAESRRDDAARSPIGDLSREALRRVPAVIVSALAVGAIVVAAIVGLLLPMVLAIAVDGGAVAIALAAVFGGLAAVALAFWLAIRLSLAVALAALGGHGIGVSRSWELTRDRFWGVFGRLMIASLIASVVSAPLNLLVNFGLFSFAVFMFVVTLFQAVSTAASVLITTPASVVLIDHLDERYVAPSA